MVIMASGIARKRMRRRRRRRGVAQNGGHTPKNGLTEACSLGLPCTFLIERFLFECRKVIGFAFATPHDWLRNLEPLSFFIESEVKPKPIVTYSHTFSRALRQLPVSTSSFDWFTVLCVFLVIG